MPFSVHIDSLYPTLYGDVEEQYTLHCVGDVEEQYTLHCVGM